MNLQHAIMSQSRLHRSMSNITGKEFLELLFRTYESYLVEEQVAIDQEAFRNAPYQYARRKGILEEQDLFLFSSYINRRDTARILHQFLRMELREPETNRFSNASQLADLYDCRTCVNHIAQVYEKGIMDSVGSKDGVYIFGVRDLITKMDAYQAVMRVFHKDLRRNRELKKLFPKISERESLLKENNVSPHYDLQDTSIVKMKMKRARTQIAEQMQKGIKPILIDVRSESEYETVHENDFISIPFSKILKEGTVPYAIDQPVYLYCDMGYRNVIVATCLQQHGYQEVYCCIPDC